MIEGKMDIIHPYTLGLTHLANVIESDGPWDLDRLTDDSQICSLGSETTGHWNSYPSPEKGIGWVLHVSSPSNPSLSPWTSFLRLYRNMWLAKIVLGLSSAIAAYGQYLSTIPDVIPLIHKAPYVNSWIGSRLVGDWPQFFNGRVSGLVGLD